jgi:hypothetical protein
MMQECARKGNGFGLIFVAALLIVAGTVITELMVVAPSHNVTAAAETKRRLKEVRYRIRAYKTVLGKALYPCPSSIIASVSDTSHFGVEVVGCSIASTDIAISGNVAIGGLPTKTLGLPDYYAFDAWGNRLLYLKDLGDLGSITVTNIAGGNNPLWSHEYNGFDMTHLAVAVVSHGPDAVGAYNRAGVKAKACNAAHADGENCDNDAVLIYDSWDDTALYDDVLVGIRADE